jgi:hypothetical protein
MGEHDAPVSWLQRWQEQEPLRLYLWTVASAVLLGGVATGLVTETWALAVGGVLAAVLMLGGTALARSHVSPAATVDRLQQQWELETDQLLDEQHALSFEQGGQSVLRAVQETNRTPEQVALQLHTGELEATAPHPHVSLPRDGDYPTTAMAAVGARQALPRCRHVEDRRRCTLPQHPEKIDHQLEGGGRLE